MLRSGLPLGPNTLITVTGRKTGEPRTQPLAVVRLGQQRWVIGTFGDTNWCRNMRANPDIEIGAGERVEPATAIELDPADATAFFRDTLPAAITSMGVFGKIASFFLIGLAAPEIRNDPSGAALRHPVFELVARP
jgi:deazaflavin-dependent oxidoreductase (nitroreductase family)